MRRALASATLSTVTSRTGPNDRPRLDEQVYVLAVQTYHLWVVVRDSKSQMIDIESCRFLWVLRLNQNVRTEAVCH